MKFATTEEINDSPDPAALKRIPAFVAGHQKPLLGVLAVLEIGLTMIRAECPHFDGWLKTIAPVRRGQFASAPAFAAPAPHPG
jgi:hypothetical protein